MLQNHCLKPFTFTTKEFDEVLELVKLRNDSGHEYFRSWVDLNQRKDKLFQAGDPTKWEIDFKEIQLNADDISKNKKIAKTLMLPGVYFYNKASHNLKQMQKVFGFLNTQLLDQSHFHALKRAKRYIKAMTELSNEMIQHFAESTSNFRDLSNSSCKIFENIATKEQEINDYILQGLEIPKSS